MATAKGSGRKTGRQPNYHNYGTEGRYVAQCFGTIIRIANDNRVTGLKLAPRPRDEHGLEEMEGIFSPTPGKPSVRSSKRAKLSNGTSLSSETMVIAESTLRAHPLRTAT